jgi:hypothetical protein
MSVHGDPLAGPEDRQRLALKSARDGWINAL